MPSPPRLEPLEVLLTEAVSSVSSLSSESSSSSSAKEDPPKELDIGTGAGALGENAYSRGGSRREGTFTCDRVSWEGPGVIDTPVVFSICLRRWLKFSMNFLWSSALSFGSPSSSVSRRVESAPSNSLLTRDEKIGKDVMAEKRL